MKGWFFNMKSINKVLLAAIITIGVLAAGLIICFGLPYITGKEDPESITLLIDYEGDDEFSSILTETLIHGETYCSGGMCNANGDAIGKGEILYLSVSLSDLPEGTSFTDLSLDLAISPDDDLTIPAGTASGFAADCGAKYKYVIKGNQEDGYTLEFEGREQDLK